ncbi:zinc finger protein 287-like [Asterias rubens]|uniref:zinc finger protein 287-like n=1 Tax=Asterias rubens TaxID=7604 RepID=UPI0014558F50|nr:zinc finger protein 287-like [Asterias rubens]
MRFIENPELREWVKENLCRTVFQKAHELAVQTGCEVLVKLQDGANQSGQYYATRALHLLYKGKGLTKQPWEVTVSGITGLPETVLVDKSSQSDGWKEDGGSKEDAVEVVSEEMTSSSLNLGDYQVTSASSVLNGQSVCCVDNAQAVTRTEESIKGSVIVKEEHELGQFAEPCSSSIHSHNHDFGIFRVLSENKGSFPDQYQPNDELNSLCDYNGNDNESGLTLAKSDDTMNQTLFQSQICAASVGTDQNQTEIHCEETETVVPTPRPYKCGICSKTFGSIQILSRHAQINHGMDRQMSFFCDVCGQSYKLAQHLQRHMHMHRTVMPYICSVCHKGFFNGTSLIKHEKVHQKFSDKVCTVFHCQICLKYFPQVSELDEHAKQVHGSRRCASGAPSSQHAFPTPTTDEITEGDTQDVLEETFQNDNFLSDTTALPGGSLRPVSPQVILDSSENSGSPHSKTEHSKKKDDNQETTPGSPISSIADTFSNAPNTNSGIRLAFKRNIGLISSGSQSSNLFRLNRHNCNICGKSYKYNFSLKEHLLTHASVPQFSCKICGTKFTRRRQLRDHMFRHSGLYPYHCEICGKGCIRPSTLKRHQTERHRMLNEEL